MFCFSLWLTEFLIYLLFFLFLFIFFCSVQTSNCGAVECVYGGRVIRKINTQKSNGLSFKPVYFLFFLF